MMITETAGNSAATALANGGGKIRRSSFKSRGGPGGAQTYRAVRVTVPSTMVAELASKFNAVVVDAGRGATTRDIIKKVNKTLSQGAAVKATVEKFESVAEKDGGGGGGGDNRVVLVRTNSSDQRAAMANQRAAAAAAAAANQRAAATVSLVKRRMEQFQNGKKPASSKPKVLGPKPKVADGHHERGRPPHKSGGGGGGPATIDRLLLNKHKRLSIARDPDAQLESVLNATTCPRRPADRTPSPEIIIEAKRATPDRTPSPEIEAKQTVTADRTPSPEIESKQTATADRTTSPEIRPKPNSSFLHNRKRLPTTAAAATTTAAAAAATTVAEERLPIESPAVGEPRPKSFLHTYKNKAADEPDDYDWCVDGQAIYEELPCHASPTSAPSAEDPSSPAPHVVPEGSYYEGATEHHYMTIDGGELQNIYYDVVTVAPDDRSKRPEAADEDGNYETVRVPVLPSPPPPQTLPDDDGGPPEKKSSPPLPPPSDICSVEIDNSIYGLNPPSESTSSGVTSDSASADRNSKFDLDEEWVDVDNTSDELQEIIVFRQKPKLNDSIAKGWSIQVRKQLSKAYEIKEKTNAVGGQGIPEEIYADYDSFESDDSWDDCKDGDRINRVSYPCENRVLPALPSQQNIYGFMPLVKRAGDRMKKRWSLGTLGLKRIRKLGVGTLTADFGSRVFDSTSDKSTDRKFNPPEKCNSLSSSVFYLQDPIYNNIENVHQITAPVRNASKPPSSNDSRRLSVARPSSPPPPPPPPPMKRHSTGTNAYDGSSLPRSIGNSKGRPSSALDRINNATETVSENGSNQGSDLYMRFADEPLYQFYAADISVRTKSVFAGDMMEECDGYEEISSITSRPSALELITPCPSGHGQHRSLWCEVPEVKNSGILDALKPRERKLQEAKFELITSEASYFKSLTVLEKHFVNSHSMNDETILSKNDRKILFGNVNPVRKCSEKLLAALEKCWQDSILLKGLCEILYTHSKENFEIFVKYCSNQIYIDRTLKILREKNFKFNEALHRLESDTKCQSLSLHSFLMLPMQRITRLPLLVDAILSQMDSTENSLEYQMCELTLASLNSIVQNCNESTRKLERYEEMLTLSRQLEFSNKREMKAMSVASSSRWLVRSGSMFHLISPDAKLTFSRKLIRPTKLYFFLFNDMFFIAKRKSDESYTVVDYCARNFVQMVDATELVFTSSYKNLLMLTILENHEAKTVEMLLSCDSESSKKRWIEAMSPPISSNPDETLYNEWDCPQVFAEHPYTSIQPDELSLQNGDIVKVLTKMNDGWYHGERIRDGEKGWFPGNYTSEIASQHARAKNLKQRYRLLAMSGSYLQSQQDKIKKK